MRFFSAAIYWIESSVCSGPTGCVRSDVSALSPRSLSAPSRFNATPVPPDGSGTEGGCGLHPLGAFSLWTASIWKSTCATSRFAAVGRIIYPVVPSPGYRIPFGSASHVTRLLTVAPPDSRPPMRRLISEPYPRGPRRRSLVTGPIRNLAIYHDTSCRGSCKVT